MNSPLLQCSSLLGSAGFSGRQILARSPVAPVTRGARQLIIRAGTTSHGPLGNRWYPGAKVPAHLEKADLPGTHGFDPLRLGTNPTNLSWYAEAERYNGRIAMTGVLGIMFVELAKGTNWVNAGAEVDLILPLPTLILIELVVFALLEAKRYQNWKETGQGGFLGSAPFDPAGLDSPANREKEISNGRLAMMAFVGFISVYTNRGMLPIEALKAHIADPGHQNIFTTSQAKPILIATIALCILPIVIEARQSLDDEDDEFEPIPW